MRDAPSRELLAALAELLSYPQRDAAPAARRALALAGSGAAAAALARFAAAVEATAPAALEELYTRTFDVSPACAPYVGAQLLGDDSPVRGPLLARLSEVFTADGYRPREELPDHVAEVLGYLAVARPGTERDDLVRDGLLPALARMLETFQDHLNPYRELLLAVHGLLAPESAAPAIAAGAESCR
jgi:nitrate reductase delta subunit